MFQLSAYLVTNMNLVGISSIGGQTMFQDVTIWQRCSVTLVGCETGKRDYTLV